MTDKIGYIYIIENNFDDNVYIGLTTKTPDKRFIEHKHKAETTPCSAFHKFMALKGIENFHAKTLKTIHYKYIIELQLAEEECIRDLGTLNTVHNVNSPVKVDSELITLNKVANAKKQQKIMTKVPELPSKDQMIQILNEAKEFITLEKAIDMFLDEEFNFGLLLKSLTNNNDKIAIHGAVLDWLGYESKKEYDNKASFIQLLNSHNIQFQQIKQTNPNFKNYPDIVQEAKFLSVASLKSKQWIIMNSRDFKKMVMCLRTKKADQILDYYLNLEDLVKMYSEYTHHLNPKTNKIK